MRLTRDALGGILLILISAIFAAAASRHQFGTLLRMGPGFYPILISVLLAVIGLALAIGGVGRSGEGGPDDEVVEVEIRTAAAVLGSVLAFGFALQRIGLVGSTFILVGVAALAERQPNMIRAVVLSIGLAAIAVAIFSYALGLNIPLFRWRF